MYFAGFGRLLKVSAKHPEHVESSWVKVLHCLCKTRSRHRAIELYCPLFLHYHPVLESGRC